jgi:hypothetical protein
MLVFGIVEIAPVFGFVLPNRKQSVQKIPLSRNARHFRDINGSEQRGPTFQAARAGWYLRLGMSARFGGRSEFHPAGAPGWSVDWEKNLQLSIGLFSELGPGPVTP